MAVRITGPGPNELFGLADRIKQKLNEISSAQNISDDWGPKIKKVVVDIDQSKTQNAGLTNQDIALSLQTALTGFNTGAFREGDQSLPIVLRNESSQDVDVRQLESINIYAQGSGQKRASRTSGADRASVATPQDQKARPVPHLDRDLRCQKRFYGAGYHRRAHPLARRRQQILAAGAIATS